MVVVNKSETACIVAIVRAVFVDVYLFVSSLEDKVSS